MRRVLFVCSGNICRSPMAELLFRQLLQEQGIDWIRHTGDQKRTGHR